MKGGEFSYGGDEGKTEFRKENMFDGDENTIWHSADGVVDGVAHAKGVVVVFNVSFCIILFFPNTYRDT